jgi:EmrB/QacA subfamily drug resistance transporter
MRHAQKHASALINRKNEVTMDSQPTQLDPKRWLVLIVIAVCQLMIVLDASIVNIALPQAQHALQISNADRQWVVTAYTLTFGGLLLLGGRVADFMGRKQVFIAGLIGFAVASALGGLAPDAAVLFGARALQGGFAALMAPAALSLLAVTFTEPRERATAFSVYGGISGGGAAIGLILGGVLTEYASWRWCLLVNVPVALITAVCAMRLVRESRAEGTAHYDIPGAVTVTLGLVGLVYGFTKAESDGWGSSITLTYLLVAVALLAAFVAIEARSKHPLLPLRVVLERNRGGAFIAALLSGMGLFGMFLFLTYYLQGTLHYSALKAGFAFLPFSIGIVIGAGLTSQLLPKLGPRNLMVPGLLLAAAGLLWFTRIGISASYALHVLPAEIVVSIGMGLVFVTVASTALVGVADQDAGVASALVNTSQQVGGSLGTALLNTIAATATTHYLVAHHGVVQAGLVHGYRLAFAVSAVVLAAGLVAAFLLIRAGRDDLPDTDATVIGNDLTDQAPSMTTKGNYDV